MQERHVGHSGLQVSRLGLGTMTFGSQVDELEAEDQLAAFLDAGGTFIDTAPVYGDGRAEALVGDLLAKRAVRDGDAAAEAELQPALVRLAASEDARIGMEAFLTRTEATFVGR